ncbi:MAG: AraC family transcriptional regulator [Paracoccaceae bacterium]
MPKPPNPNIFRPMDVPSSIKPYVRRILMADSSDKAVDMVVNVSATGYHYFGWTWRGKWEASVNGNLMFDTDKDGPLHVTGQVKKSDVAVRLKQNIGQVFFEFSALGHYQVLGITGLQLVENPATPEALNPALEPHMARIRDAGETTVNARLDLIAEIFDAMPKHTVPSGIIAAIEQVEAADGDIRIADLARISGMAERQFRTLFIKLIGISPKVFCKILQINSAFNRILISNGGDLADVALRSGFSDQAHFTRAFGEFLGKAPKSYLKNVEATLERFVGHSRT